MKRLLALACAAALIPACSKSSSGDSAAPAAPPRPAAVAGADQKARTGTTVTLNGAASSDPQGDPLTFEWTQLSGTPVTLSDPAAASPTFTAPGSAGTLSFQLRVTSALGTDSDVVDVEVKTLLVSAPDAWFVGYGKSGTLTAAVAGGTGPFTYEWSGVEPWLAVSGEDTATLLYTAPTLSDFQSFPDRFGVAFLERTTQGRLQLAVRVVDTATGAEDVDIVNFSVGPFADATANENLALGEPAFLNGGETVALGSSTSPITVWSWQVRRPNGTTNVPLLLPNKDPLVGTAQRYVYFVPDMPGDWQVTLVQNDGLTGETERFLLLTAGSYVGVGNKVGTPPDPFKGECASCHGGQFGWLADLSNPWRETGHARAFENLLDPLNAFFAPSQAKGLWEDAFNFGSPHSIDSRVVGFSRITTTANDGWAKRASDGGFVLGGATWEETVRKHPKVAELAGVQCESCHGPGSEHRADSTGIRKSFDSGMCSRCHASENQHWESSHHAKPATSSPTGNTSCNGCHTAQGFVVEMRAQKGVDPHTALFAVGNPARPVLPIEERRGTTCQACHDPHERTAKRGTPAGEADPQLRAYGDVKFRNDAVAAAGNAASCYVCHQSRTDTRAGSTDMNGRRAPHDGTSAEMLSATNAFEFAGWSYDSSPHGIPSRFVSPFFGENRQCLACHKDVSPAVGESGYGVLGGHTFAMKQGSGGVIASEGTHAGGASVGGTRKFSVSSGAPFLKSAAPGDLLTLSGGADAGSYVVRSVDGARQVTLNDGAAFTGGAPTSWALTSVEKYNTASCSQCHSTALAFEQAARGDYDNDGNAVETVQEELDGLIALLSSVIETKLLDYTGVAATLEPASGRIRYRKTVANVLRTFPGPSVSAGDNPDLPWASLTPSRQAEWTALYMAAYNISFVKNDKSRGIHNTGYAVNLLQASHQAVTGTPWPSLKRFVPFP